MKKLFLFSVAALAFCACSSDETVSENSAANQQPKEISFASLNKVNTRAAADIAGAVEGTTFPTTLEMTVGAYDVTNNREFFATPVDFAYNYANSSATPGNGKGYWGGKTAKYWPLSATQINFLAIANANVDPTFNAISTNNKTVTIAQTDNYAYSKQNDLMYARGTGEVTFGSNTLTFPDKVDMTFQHAQAYLVFRLRAADATTAGAITIKDILVKDAYYSGTATVTHTNWNLFSSQNVSVAWAGHTKHGSTPFNYSVNTNNQTAWASGTQALTTDYVELGHTIVLPHASAGFSTFTIQYWLDGKAYSFEYTPASTVLVAGKKYIYDITMKLHEIFINPSVTDWVDEGQFVNIPAVAIGSNINFGTISKKEAIYKFNITGTTGTVTVATTGTATEFATPAPSVAAGVVTFKVNANTGAARTYTLVITDDNGTAGDTSDDKKSTITFTQAAGV